MQQLRVESLEDSIQSLNHRMEKIEEHWVEIKETADKSGEWARWLMIAGIGLAALFLGFLIIFTIISTSRIRRDLEEIKKMREQATSILEFLRGSRDETINELERTREEREKLKQEGKDLQEIDKRLEELSHRLDTLRRMGLPLDARGWHEKYYEFAKRGHYGEAIAALDEAISLDIDNSIFHNSKTYVLLVWGARLKDEGEEEKAKEKFEEAKESAQKAIELSKGKKGYYNLACAQARLGEWKEALVSLRKSKENKEEITVAPWEDPDFEELIKKYPHEFEGIVGQPPEEEKP